MKRKTSLATVFLLMLVSLVMVTSCSDDDSVEAPNAITLNMLDEGNGKTLLGNSNVYINSANNFCSYSSYISDLGESDGLIIQKPDLNNLVAEAAVVTTHHYQVFDRDVLQTFHSGEKAVELGSFYYDLYVLSPINKEDKKIGTTIKYLLHNVEMDGLPKSGTKIADLSGGALRSVSVELPKGIEEFFWYDGVDEALDISFDEGNMLIYLHEEATEYNGLAGDYEIYARKGNVFTKLIIHVF